MFELRNAYKNFSELIILISLNIILVSLNSKSVISETEFKTLKLKIIDSSDKIELGQTKWWTEDKDQDSYLNSNTKTSKQNTKPQGK